MRNKTLEGLVKTKILQSYEYDNISFDNVVGEKSDSRNTERLILVFSDGQKLKIETICSGVREDANLIIWE